MGKYQHVRHGSPMVLLLKVKMSYYNRIYEINFNYFNWKDKVIFLLLNVSITLKCDIVKSPFLISITNKYKALYLIIFILF